MRYIDAAFKQLSFAWKIYDYALRDKIDLSDLDRSITFEENGMVLVLPDRIFESPEEMIIALENNLSVAFGAAAITLNRCREEANIGLPNPIESEQDQFVSIIYQIRNAFAHDISEPCWNITQERYARIYEFGGIAIDLTSVGTKQFEYADIGGPDVLYWLKQYGDEHIWR
ncbi:hypothetical protein ACIQW9_07190 [Herminiimonas sp. NPDC097707]|uniref:hypothetical protein n=1 Tax=Herminiimonas sp. NPDC097707 TaxID=3364007 RepID=UPI00383A77AD